MACPAASLSAVPVATDLGMTNRISLPLIVAEAVAACS
jgi:hypothetical protein